MTFVIFATGQSLSLMDVGYVKKCHEKHKHIKIIAVSDAFRMVPWADMLASFDVAWWRHNRAAEDMAGLKFCASSAWAGIGHYRPEYCPPGCNSGLYAMYLAKALGAKKIILLGFDMWGTHFFGPHPEPLKNTNEKRFNDHLYQFKSWQNDDIEVINCTPESRLLQFPQMTLQEALPC